MFAYIYSPVLLAVWLGFWHLLGQAESGLFCARDSVMKMEVSLHCQHLPSHHQCSETPGPDGCWWYSKCQQCGWAFGALCIR